MTDEETAAAWVGSFYAVGRSTMQQAAEGLIAQVRREERERCVFIINDARETGETDLRQVRARIESGYVPGQSEGGSK